MFCQHSVSHSNVTCPWPYSDLGGRYSRTPLRVGLESTKNLEKKDTHKFKKIKCMWDEKNTKTLLLISFCFLNQILSLFYVCFYSCHWVGRPDMRHVPCNQQMHLYAKIYSKCAALMRTHTQTHMVGVYIFLMWPWQIHHPCSILTVPKFKQQDDFIMHCSFAWLTHFEAEFSPKGSWSSAIDKHVTLSTRHGEQLLKIAPIQCFGFVVSIHPWSCTSHWTWFQKLNNSKMWKSAYLTNKKRH